MKQRFLFPILISLISSVHVSAQSKSIQHLEQTWAGYFNQTRVNKSWGFWFDGQLRTKENFTHQLSQLIIRPGLTYYLNDDAKLTVGYAYVNHFPGDNHKNISMPEHRPWFQLQWHNKFESLKLMQWIRFEGRFRHKVLNDAQLADGYNVNFRTRVNLLLQYPLGKQKFAPGSLSLAAGSEVMVNLGKIIVNNTFDQNRFFVGFHYHVNKHDFLQFGYMNVFQQLASGNQYKSINTIRINYFHNLNLMR